MVALTGGEEGETLIRRGARIAARSTGGDLLAVHVTRSDGLTGADPAALAEQRRLTESLGGTYHQVVGDDIPEALLSFARAENATQLVLGASRRSWLAALLTGPGFGARTIRGSGDIDVHIVTHSHMGRGRGLLPRSRGGLTLRRRLAGYGLAVVLCPLLTLVLASLRGQLNLTSDVLAFLVAVIAVALVGGLIPAVLVAIAGSLLLNYYFTRRCNVHHRRGQQRLALGCSWPSRSSSAGGGHRSPADRQAARASAESELLVTTAGNVLRGQRALEALLDRVREAFGMESVTCWRWAHSRHGEPRADDRLAPRGALRRAAGSPAVGRRCGGAGG